MRHDEFLMENHKFNHLLIDDVELFTNQAYASRIAKKLKAEVVSVRYLIKNKIWVLATSHPIQFERALKRAAQLVESWPVWKQNILDNCGPVVAREPIMNLDCDCY